MTLCVWAKLIRSTEQRKRQNCPLAGSGRVVRYEGLFSLMVWVEETIDKRVLG